MTESEIRNRILEIEEEMEKMEYDAGMCGCSQCFDSAEFAKLGEEKETLCEQLGIQT